MTLIRDAQSDTPPPAESCLDEENIGEKKFLETEPSQRGLLSSPFWMARGRWMLLGIGLGVLLSVGATRFISSPAKTEKPPTSSKIVNSQVPAQSVTVATVEVASVNRTLKATGTVSAFESIAVLSQATGLQIQRVFVDEGDVVQAGQVLATLDDSVLQARLRQAQATVAQSQARLAELKAGYRSEEIARARESIQQTQAEIAQAESELELAQKRTQRNLSLEAEGAIARDRLDEVLSFERNKRATLDQSRAKLREAQQRLAELEAGPRIEVIAQAAAQLAETQAQVQVISAQLKDTRIVAPVSGKISERNARLGYTTSATSDTPLFRIIEGGRLELRLKVPETQISLIRPGQKVEITADGDNKLKLTGKVREINPIVDEASRQATVDINLPANSGLKPGMFLRSEIVTQTATSLTAPMGAILPQSDGQAIVYRLQSDKTVKAVPVTLGKILANERVEIIDGLKAGDRLVVKGAAYLKEGDRVSVISYQ